MPTKSATQGNVIFSYSQRGAGRHTFRCYGDIFSHVGQVVYEESEARRFRALYPRAFAVGPFAVGVMSNGYREFVKFNNWMTSYMNYLLDPKDSDEVPIMSVLAVGKGLLRLGIPQGGIEYGDNLGKALYRQTIAFEAANDPLDIQQSAKASSFVNPTNATDFNTDYFYPDSKYVQAEGTLTPVQAAQLPYDQTYVIHDGPAPDSPPAPPAPPAVNPFASEGATNFQPPEPRQPFGFG